MRIVICGSMSAIEKMKSVAAQLEDMGFSPILPKEEDWSGVPESKIHEFKRILSMGHFAEVAHEDTRAIVVINEPKNGVADYIGANTFAEIALAFYFGKKIFLLNNIYDKLADELLAWGAIPLFGDVRDVRVDL